MGKIMKKTTTKEKLKGGGFQKKRKKGKSLVSVSIQFQNKGYSVLQSRGIPLSGLQRQCDETEPSGRVTARLGASGGGGWGTQAGRE